MSFETAWTERSDWGLLVAVALPVAPADPDGLALLHEDEAALARGWALKRRRTYAGGRLALRRALAMAGLDDGGPILRDDRGAPILPAGARGSVTHKDDLAVAIVDRAGDERVGIDLEALAGSSRDVARYVLTARELAEIAALDEDARRREVLLRFSLKEALYKALDPYVRRYVGFDEVEARPSPDGTAALALALKPGEGPFAAEARFALRGDDAISLARVRLLRGAGA